MTQNKQQTSKLAAVVLGMHRSGTSALAQVLTKLGFAQAHQIMPAQKDNPLGFWEPQEIVSLNNRILEALGTWWSDQAWFLSNVTSSSVLSASLPASCIEPFAATALTCFKASYKELDVICLKDPRICLLLPLWRQVLQQAGFQTQYFYAYRHPLAVAMSLRIRNNFSTSHALSLWLRYNIAILGIYQDLGDVEIIDFDDMLDPQSDSWKRLLYRCQTLGVGRANYDLAELQHLVDADEVHYQYQDFGFSRVYDNQLVSLVRRLDKLLKSLLAGERFDKDRFVSIVSDHMSYVWQRADFIPLHGIRFTQKQQQTMTKSLQLQVKPDNKQLPASSVKVAENTKASTLTSASSRAIILHYHLFKNAGTSIDTILKKNFGELWVSKEFSAKAQAVQNQAQIVEWIISQPQAIAFSSHTMLMPVPELAGVDIYPIIFVRHPVDRIYSAYNFERLQSANTYGAELAKATDFAGYVQARLARKEDYALENFQSCRMVAWCKYTDEELQQKLQAVIAELPFIGLVEAFDKSLDELKRYLSQVFPEIDVFAVKANVTDQEIVSIDSKITRIKAELGEELYEELKRHNAVDFYLYNQIKQRYAGNNGAAIV